MKTINYKEIDGFAVITSIVNPTIDPQKTKIRVKELLAESPEILSTKTVDELFNEQAVYFQPGPGQMTVADEDAEELQDTLLSLQANQKLLVSGDIVADFRSVEYHIKQADKWEKTKIEKLGVELPDGAIRSENLSSQQQKEIAEQAEADRIAGLSPEQKAAEKEKALAAARHEIRALKEDAEACEEPFDAPAEYQNRKETIEAKYA